MQQPGTAPRNASGLTYGIIAYVMWGIFPLYFKLLANVSPWVVLSHRIIWSAVFLGLIISWRHEWPCIRPAISTRRGLFLLTLGSILIAINWLVFIYAVGRGLVLQSSLGYFMLPLLTIVLGMVFLGERLRRWQWVAVSVAAIAVINLAFRGTLFPWVALTLATSFGLYGLVRKKLNINSLHALFIETVVLLPVAAGLLAFLPGSLQANAAEWSILLLAGLVTATPMLLFGAALRTLKMSTMGFLQYIGPTLQFLLAIAIFQEPLDPAKLASFILCWLAIAIYLTDSALARRPTVSLDTE